jgi:hypothetical protein
MLWNSLNKRCALLFVVGILAAAAVGVSARVALAATCANYAPTTGGACGYIATMLGNGPWGTPGIANRDQNIIGTTENRTWYLWYSNNYGGTTSGYGTSGISGGSGGGQVYAYCEMGDNGTVSGRCYTWYT